MPKPYPQEFRDDVVRVARTCDDGEQPGITREPRHVDEIQTELTRCGVDAVARPLWR